MSVPPQPPNKPNNPKLAADPSTWVSLDEWLHSAGIDVRANQSWNSVPAGGSSGTGGGDDGSGGGDDGSGGGSNCSSCCCCCCCCCCCKPKQPPTEPPPPVSIEIPTVTMAARWEQLVDPKQIQAGVQALRGELRWRARGPQATQVEIEARTEDAHGAAAGPYPDWTTIVRDRSPVDVAITLIDRNMGHTVRLRAKASAPTGELGYSDVLTVRAPG